MATQLKNLSDFSETTVPSAAPFKFGIVVSEWNSAITNALYGGAYESLIKLDAVICLGCVIQGETRHFDFICQAVANGVSNVAIKYSKPVIFGVLTTDNQQQAIDRSGGIHGNKGVEAAVTAIKMADLAETLNN